jgi:hypothetical protein
VTHVWPAKLLTYLICRALAFPNAKTPPKDAGMSRRLNMGSFGVSGLTPRKAQVPLSLCTLAAHDTLSSMSTHVMADLPRPRTTQLWTVPGMLTLCMAGTDGHGQPQSCGASAASGAARPSATGRHRECAAACAAGTTAEAPLRQSQGELPAVEDAVH